jgi:23S rRNA pseudouridine2605 synthase
LKKKQSTKRLLRLNRALAACGLCSRRKADLLIAEGQVRVNGELVTDFNRMVDLGRDKLAVDGVPLHAKRLDYVVMNKPKGVVVTCDDERGRRTVIDLLPEELMHLKPVGRLDSDSEGLLLLTNDGELARVLTHPSHEVPKLYRVNVEGDISKNAITALRQGVRLSEGMTEPAYVRKISASPRYSQLEIELREGKNRQIRRMLAQVGYRVTRLVRVAIGGLQLSQLESGAWRRLNNQELALLNSVDDNENDSF